MRRRRSARVLANARERASVEAWALLWVQACSTQRTKFLAEIGVRSLWDAMTEKQRAEYRRADDEERRWREACA